MSETTMTQATMDMLRWCRVEDVLRWEFDFKVSFYKRAIKKGITESTEWWATTKRISDLTIPAPEFTASVIARAVMNIEEEMNWESAKWYEKTGNLCLEFDEETGDTHGIREMYIFMPNPDPTNSRSEWTREEIEATLENMK